MNAEKTSETYPYTVGERYSPFDVPGLSVHRGHGLALYQGIDNHCHAWRCDGCSDEIFIVA